MTTVLLAIAFAAQAATQAARAPPDVKPGSITCEDVSVSVPVVVSAADARTARTCASRTWTCAARARRTATRWCCFTATTSPGFYFGGPIDALRKEGFRVVVPDQIGYGRSSKPIIPYNFHDMARNTRADPAAA